MIIKTENIIQAPENIIIHGCNMQGVMGAGVAAAIRGRWPVAYKIYKQELPRRRLGQVIWAEVGTDKIVANCLTQEFYGNDGKIYASLDAIHESLQIVADMLVFLYDSGFYYTTAMPKIGCGYGGLKWEQVCPIVESTIPNTIIYEMKG